METAWACPHCAYPSRPDQRLGPKLNVKRGERRLDGTVILALQCPRCFCPFIAEKGDPDEEYFLISPVWIICPKTGRRTWTGLSGRGRSQA